MSIKFVDYQCSYLNKKITVTEDYGDVPAADYKFLKGISCSGMSSCGARTKCKFFGQSNPTLYIDASYN